MRLRSWHGRRSSIWPRRASSETPAPAPAPAPAAAPAAAAAAARCPRPLCLNADVPVLRASIPRQRCSLRPVLLWLPASDTATFTSNESRAAILGLSVAAHCSRPAMMAARSAGFSRSFSASPSAARLLRSCSQVTAPESTYGSNGCARMAASASWSWLQPSTARGFSSGYSWLQLELSHSPSGSRTSLVSTFGSSCSMRGSSRPLASPSFTIMSSPASRASQSAACADCSRQL